MLSVPLANAEHEAVERTRPSPEDWLCFSFLTVWIMSWFAQQVNGPRRLQTGLYGGALNHLDRAASREKRTLFPL